MTTTELQASRLAGFERAACAPASRPRASPISMRLQAVREHQRVVDFRCESVSAATAYLLHCHPLALRGKRLREVAAAGPLCHPALIDRYRHVLEHGRAQSFEQVHRVDGWQDIVIHHVVPEHDGVAVTLINVSTDRRARAHRLQSIALEAGLRRNAP